MVNVETLYDLFVFEVQETRSREADLGAALETLTTQSDVDSLDDRPGAEFRERAGELFERHGDRADERRQRLDDALDALDRPTTRGEHTESVVDALVADTERFDNVVLDDALRNPFYLDAAIAAEQLVVDGYGSALDVADHLDANSEVVEALEANRDDAEGALDEARDLDSGEAVASLFDRLAEGSPED